jgi:hypothetical protein
MECVLGTCWCPQHYWGWCCEEGVVNMCSFILQFFISLSPLYAGLFVGGGECRADSWLGEFRHQAGMRLISAKFCSSDKCTQRTTLASHRGMHSLCLLWLADSSGTRAQMQRLLAQCPLSQAGQNHSPALL